jgi:hypothetical protein
VRGTKIKPEPKATAIDATQEDVETQTWFKAVYHFHVFHYRMPDMAAIAAITPFVPSPLTVKMAMIASLFQTGDLDGVRRLSEHLDSIEVRIVPPKAALSFKAFLRYRSPPAIGSEKGLDATGSYYPSRPHMREYAIFQDCLTVYVGLPKNIKQCTEKALRNIRYLGAKDSLVTCIEITEDLPDKNNCAREVTTGLSGTAVFLADFKPRILIENIQQLIPGSRDENMYEKKPYMLPGKIITKGKSRLFIRES